MLSIFSKQFLLQVLSGRTSNAFSAILTKKLKQYNDNLTKQQWVLLSILWKKEGVTQYYLSENIFRDYPTTSRLLDSLEEGGYIERKYSKEDRRVRLIFLTSKGKDMKGDVMDIVNRVVEKATKDIPEKELEITQKTLDEIFSNI